MTLSNGKSLDLYKANALCRVRKYFIWEQKEHQAKDYMEENKDGGAPSKKIKVQHQEFFLNHQQLISRLLVGKEEQWIIIVDSSVISLIEARIEHYFDILIWTYMDNKGEIFFVPYKCSRYFLMDFDLEIYVCLWIWLFSWWKDFYWLIEKVKSCILLIREFFLIKKIQECVCKEGLEKIAILTWIWVLKNNKPFTLQVNYYASRPKHLSIFGGIRRIAMQFLG